MPIITSKVRKAGWSDDAEIRAMMWDGYLEHEFFQPSEARIQEMCRKAFDRDGAIIGAIGPVGAVESIIYLAITQFEYTDEWCLCEVHNYVRPEFRRTSNAKDMIDFGKRCSEELGLRLVIGVVSNERTKAKMELYRRRLGEPAGGYFVWPPKPVQSPAIGLETA